MKFLKLNAKNFCCFEKIELDLNSVGLIWITGINKDSRSAVNNGCGKTTLLKSIMWCLYGSVLSGDSGDSIIRAGCNEAIVELSVKYESTDYLISRRRKKGQPILKLFVGKSEIKLDKQELQEYIVRLIGLDFTSFKNTVFYGQGYSKFANLNTRDSERKKILHSILGLEFLEGCYKTVRALNAEKTRELFVAEKKVEKYSSLIKEQNLSELKKDMFDFESKRKEELSFLNSELKTELDYYEKHNIESKKDNEEIKKDIEKAQNSIDRIRENINNDSLSNINVKIESSKINIDKFTDILNDLNKQKIKLETNLEHIYKQLNKLNGEKCPVCGSDSNSLNFINTKNRLTEEKDLILEEIKKLNELISKSHFGKNNEIEKLSNFNKKLKEIELISEKLYELEQNIEYNKKHLLNESNRFDEVKKNFEDKIKYIKNNINSVKKQKNPYLDVIKRTIKKIKTYKIEKKSAVKSKNKLLKTVSIIEFWKHGFSNRGLQSIVLDSIMEVLTDRSNYYLGILSDNDITVEFSTNRELKSGDFKEQISINWNIEGNKGYVPSGGQMKKIEIACDLALMDLTSYNKDIPDLLCLDEILDGLDEQGVKRVLLLLKDLRKNRNNIFVISHNSSMTEDFDRTINIIKENGVSRMEVI